MIIGYTVTETNPLYLRLHLKSLSAASKLVNTIAQTNFHRSESLQRAQNLQGQSGRRATLKLECIY
jgi:hypothetical protein